MTARPRIVKPRRRRSLLANTRAKPRRRRSLLADTRAATAVEYGLIIAMIVITLVLAIISVADATSGIWNNVNDKVTKAH